MHETNRTKSVLVVSPFEEDHPSVREILTDSQWDVRSAQTCVEAWRILHKTRIDVVLTECEFPEGLCWKDLLDEVENMQGAQPVVVMSRFADGRLWAEVLSLGGYDLLLKPFDTAEVLRVVTMAGRHAESIRKAQNPRSIACPPAAA